MITVRVQVPSIKDDCWICGELGSLSCSPLPIRGIGKRLAVCNGCGSVFTEETSASGDRRDWVPLGREDALILKGLMEDLAYRGIQLTMRN